MVSGWHAVPTLDGVFVWVEQGRPRRVARTTPGAPDRRVVAALVGAMTGRRVRVRAWRGRRARLADEGPGA